MRRLQEIRDLGLRCIESVEAFLGTWNTAGPPPTENVDDQEEIVEAYCTIWRNALDAKSVAPEEIESAVDPSTDPIHVGFDLVTRSAHHFAILLPEWFIKRILMIPSLPNFPPLPKAIRPDAETTFITIAMNMGRRFRSTGDGESEWTDLPAGCKARDVAALAEIRQHLACYHFRRTDEVPYGPKNVMLVRVDEVVRGFIHERAEELPAMRHRVEQEYRFALSRLTAQEDRGGQTAKSVGLEIPDGTTWGGLQLEVVNEEAIEVKVLATTQRMSLMFNELGFRDKKRCDGPFPVKAWQILLLIAMGNGEPLGSAQADPKVWNTLKQQVSILNKRLREFFGIQGQAISYEHKKGYVPHFQVIDRRPR